MTALPPWLDPLPDAQDMRDTDAWAIEHQGIPSLELMERAGCGLARVVEEVAADGPVAVVCGKGNNGGDGLAAGRLLREAGREVRVLLLPAPGELRGDTAENLRRLGIDPDGDLPEGALDAAPAVEPFSTQRLAGAAVIVDAILGTGTSGAPHGVAARAVEEVNAAGAPVVAADGPSGADASTGEVEGAAVRATATATFAAAKPGLYVAPAKALAGRVEVIDIGIPHGAPVEPAAGLITPAVLAELPRRDAPGSKFTSGHVLVCGGSAGLTGAPTLAATAAARAGAGYVTVLAPASLSAIFELKLTEVMSRGLAEEDGHLTPQAVEAVLAATGAGGALALGPGLGRDERALEVAREIARRAEVALVLDADGLNAHAGRLEDLALRGAPTVLTPHAGELGRLLGIGSDEVSARRLHHAREAARRSGAIVVLKGDDTIVAAPDGPTAINALSAPALATAGTGDVLTGVVGAYLAKDVEPFAAACAAVLVHARAGRLAADAHGPEAVMAGDVAHQLGHARAALEGPRP
ncbi:MAG: NAD(P)H-hydrate dehydratase [Solirubrobacteraceae bacterium MAG38_C4-C5]|nr:NAD(P)H-hydrate dehydratase [Candidatus Siliceabacter maunaloa]